MSFVLRICSCVVFLCTWVAFLCACEGNASKISNTGVEESTYVLQSGIGTDAATSLEGQPVQIIGNQRVEGRIGRHTFFCAPVVRKPEVKSGIF